jgi:hypothetical protein|tara:strand:+ start:690 stop:1457 length:768 start_codon:yes stop_codon:yes gene_type:complete
MNTARKRNWLIATIACACSSVGAAELQGGLAVAKPLKPVVETSRWIVNADAQSAEAGISRYVLQPGDGRHEMNILVMGDSDRMAYVNLDRIDDVSSMHITMFSNDDQLNIFTSVHSIAVDWNSMRLLRVNVEEGEIFGSMGGILDSDAVSVMNAMTSDQNLKRYLSTNESEPSIGINCNSTCRALWPLPDDCYGSFDEYECCIIEAHYDHCRRICDCFQNDNGSWGDAIIRRLCDAKANAGLVLETLDCARRLIL